MMMLILIFVNDVGFKKYECLFLIIIFVNDNVNSNFCE